jgi:4a-hydroxytetrahydrobiopterin dehydratase
MAGTSTRLSDAEIREKLSNLQGWQLESNALTKEFVLGGFTEATQFVTSIAPIANEMDHHPDVQIYRYKRVKISLSTHSEGGITQNDFDLADKIDALRR